VRLGTREATREFLAFGGEEPRAGKMEGRALRALRTGVAELRPSLALRHTQDVPNGARSVEATVSAATGGGGAGDTPATTVRLDRAEGGSASPENASPVEDSPWRARTDGKRNAEGASSRRQSRGLFANALRSRRGDRSTLDRPRSPASHLVARIWQVSPFRRGTFPKKEQEFRLFSRSLFEVSSKRF
jgi:hypothetical protein